MAAKIKKGDKVFILTGKDKGKTGSVLSVDPKEGRVLVAGVNIAKKHRKPTSTAPGQIVNIEKPIDISNVSLMENGKPAKVGFKVEEGKKIRVFKKTGNKVGN
jgi:large subunit ribosomal protein L24